MSSQDGNTCPRLPIPDPDSLIIRRRDDPRVFSMEKDSPDIVEIWHQSLYRQADGRLLTPSQCKQTFPLLVIPYFDLVVVSS
jgi:hypothetical protein